MKTNYVPSRKAIAGGVSGLIAWAILAGFGYFNVEVPLELQGLLPTLISTIVYYLVPPAQADILRRLDDRLVAIAGRDPKSDVSPEVGDLAAKVAPPAQ